MGGSGAIITIGFLILFAGIALIKLIYWALIRYSPQNAPDFVIFCSFVGVWVLLSNAIFNGDYGIGLGATLLVVVGFAAGVVFQTTKMKQIDEHKSEGD